MMPRTSVGLYFSTQSSEGGSGDAVTTGLWTSLALAAGEEEPFLDGKGLS